MAEKQKTISISELTPDDENFNLGTEYGESLMERSLAEFGAGRSIVVDRNGKIIAGNKTLEAAIKAGITEVVIVESTGDQLVAVKRIDVSLPTKKGRELALADNATAAENILFDVSAIVKAALQHDIDTSSWDMHIDFSKYETGVSSEPSASSLTDEPQVECMCPHCYHEFEIPASHE